ncbi:metal-dependent hydrolase [Aldersonia kunmingensis]|uniref:metal-dependent hydrolase n=1 Tax=Aldersonia kunmingensis TaxID=408066 RepID=UPI00082D5411|nr:metal-dependent hydrolase [Aldersonia kunmingensis]
MTDVKFRKMRFDIDATVPFQWNPDNPRSGVMANAISMVVVGFERYLVLATKEALKLKLDPEVREEAEIFIAQEAQHSAAHRKHVNSMIAQYPGLSDTFDAIIRSFDDLFAANSLEFHLAYMSAIEAAFPPLFTFLIEQRDNMYSGDTRVASMFLWHYVEEIEHRSSAGIIYDGVVGDRWYQLATLRPALSHLFELGRIVNDGFSAAVPPEDLGVDPSQPVMLDEIVSRTPLLRRFARRKPPTLFHGVPTREVMKLVVGLIKSQNPYHRAGDYTPIPWFHTWLDSYEAGEDMAHYYGAPPRVLASQSA